MHIDFPLWLRITHLINIFCLVLLARSGVQILMDHPKLYWHDDSKDGSEWIKFSKKQMPTDRLWTSMDEAETPLNNIIALPGGHHNLGAARNWHFMTIILWVATGFVYVALLFATGQWRTLIPTSWDIVPRALDTLRHYLTLRMPPAADFMPFDPLQQLAYAGVVFILSPLMILTGLAMSPTFIARFPRYPTLFGGKQRARSFHFLGLIALAAFVVVHVTMVFVVYFSNNIRNIVFGTTNGSVLRAIMIASAALLIIIVFNVWATYATLKHQRRWQRISSFILQPFFGTLLGRMKSRRQHKSKISSTFRINGYPPTASEWVRMQANDFADWKLHIGGLVEHELNLSLDDLKKLRKQTQVTEHNCIQGWTAIGEWGGVPMRSLIDMVKPTAQAKYVAFYAYDIDDQGREYYETIELRDALDPLTILAYEFDGKPLPLEHGAPLRLRCEIKYAYKMVKYLKEIRFVDDYRTLGQGAGGYREDWQFYDRIAEI